MEESVKVLVDQGVVDVMPDGRLRLTQSAWEMMVTPDDNNGKVPSMKTPTPGVPRKPGQVDYGE